MPNLIFSFSEELNASIQVGDVAYFVRTSETSEFQVNSSDIVEIGVVIAVDSDNRRFTSNSTLPPSSYPSSDDYIFFAKNNKVNQSNVLGYYAKVQLKNNSMSEAEIFAVSADAFDSSK
jgi:hypothetical protein